jgi:hypothetical protein
VVAYKVDRLTRSPTSPIVHPETKKAGTVPVHAGDGPRDVIVAPSQLCATCTIGSAFDAASEFGLTVGRADAAGIPTVQTKIVA